MAYTQITLPYTPAALEPFLDAATMTIHYGKHHATYTAKLNEAMAKHPELGEPPIEKLLTDLASVPEDIRLTVRNMGGGHYNHQLFWENLQPAGKEEWPAHLAAALSRTFGSPAQFQTQFTTAATSFFGSGWVWLVANPQQELSIITTANQDSPLSQGLVPLLALDVWEHAYYLKYQNRRADYIDAWWHIVNRQMVGQRWQLSQSASRP